MVAIFTGAGFGFERGSGAVLGGVGLLGNGLLGRGGETVAVNAATGNLLIQKQDEYLVGRGPDASVARTYNSLTTLEDDNDDNWRQSTDRRVYGLSGPAEEYGSTIKRVSGDGTEITYTFMGEGFGGYGFYSSDGAGAYDRIYQDGTDWVWVDGDTGTIERYADDGIGKIKSVIDRSGTTMTFTYDGSNRLSQVDTDDGSWIRYDWGTGGAADNITQIVTGYTDLATSTSETLTRTRYGYDGSNRLVTVTVDLSPGDSAIVDDDVYVTTYEYDGLGRVEGISQTDGSSLAITYDGLQRVASLVQTVATGVTRTTTIDYHSGYTEITDPSDQVTRLDYDGDGNLTLITAPPAYLGATAQVTQFAYNGSGDVTAITDARGQTTTYSDHYMGLARGITDRDGRYTEFTYNYDNLLEMRSKSDDVQHFIYDSDKNVRFTISGEGRVVEYRRNAYGAVISEIAYAEAAFGFGASLSEANLETWVDGLGDLPWVARTDYEYDARLNLVKQTSYALADNDGDGLTAEGVREISYVYDQAGQLLSTHADGQATTTYVYDGMGRVIATTDPQSNTTTIVFSDASTTTTITTSTGRTTAKVYNLAGDLIGSSDGGLNVTGVASVFEYEVDALGRTRITRNSNGDTLYDLYDAAGRHVAIVDDMGNLTEFRYDANNRLIATIDYRGVVGATELADLDDPNNTLTIDDIRPTEHAEDTSSWAIYDNEGRVLQTIAGDGSTTISSYDAAGRLIQTNGYSEKVDALTIAGFMAAEPVAVIEPVGGDVSYTLYFYDMDGFLTGTLDADGHVVRHGYDKAGHRIETTEYAGWAAYVPGYSDTLDEIVATITPAVSSEDRTTRYVYDGRGDLRYTVDALDRVIRYDYDAAGLKVRTVAYVEELGATSDYSFDEMLDLLATQEASDAKRVDYAVYDAAGRLAYSLDQRGTAAGSTEMAVTAYVYDVAGNVVRTVAFAEMRETSILPDLATMDTWAAGVSSDPDNRVTRMWYTARNELTYAVDAEGFVTKNAYDVKGRLVSIVVWTNPISVTDATTYGQVAAAAGGAGYVKGISYDALDRVVREWDFSGANYTDYVYHGMTDFVTRVTRAAGGDAQEQSISEMIYDRAGRVIEKIDAVGTSEEISTGQDYDGRGFLASMTDARSGTTNYTYDYNGRLTGVTDALGNETGYSYNQFGERMLSYNDHSFDESLYDKVGRVVLRIFNYETTVSTEYTAFGEIAAVRRWEGHDFSGDFPVGSGDFAETSFTYDKAGRALTSTDAMGGVESYAYNAFGDRTSLTNRLELETTYSFDRLGRVVRESHDAETLNDDGEGGVIAGAQIVRTYEYHARGELKRKLEGYSTEPGGTVTALRTTEYAYDASSRLTDVSYDAVTVIEDDMVTLTEDVTPVEHFVYDKRGNLIESVDKGGAHTFAYYDDLDRRIVEIRQLTTGEGVYTSYTYDENGNVLSTRIHEALKTLPSSGGGTPPTAPSGPVRETLFTYDALNRMLTSEIVNADNAILTGVWDAVTGSYVVSDIGNLVTQYEYDSVGNVIKVIDPNLAETWNWYDSFDRKIAQLDGEGYLTEWTYDTEGNVLSETRYATRPEGEPELEWWPEPTASDDDRVTFYTYDLNGNRLTEKRLDVSGWQVDAETGELTPEPLAYSLIRYTYNALGQVLTKEVGIDEEAAPGFLYNYIYDADGRLLKEERASFVDLDGNGVTPTTSYAYDALGNLVGREQVGAYSAASRITTYTYGQGGRLMAMTDAGGNLHEYFYDAAGRLKKDAYERIVNLNASSGSDDTAVVAEARTSTYDIAGRVTRKGVYSTIGGGLTLIDFASFQYDAFDQVIAQGSNADGLGNVLYQVTNQYDIAGRLVGTNAGDGVWRFFAHDRAGNQTAALTSAGEVFTSSIGFAGALALVSEEDVNETYTVYDKRNMATGTIELGLAISETETDVDVTGSRTYNAFGEVLTEVRGEGDPFVYTYNKMGRVIRRESPPVMIKGEDGEEYWVRPAEDYYYDQGGRLVAIGDANGVYGEGDEEEPASMEWGSGHRIRYTLLEGTGYDGSEALIATEFHADGGKKQTLYDVMGDARVLRSENFDYDDSEDTTQYFDEQFFNALGQLTQVKHKRITAGNDDSNRLVDNYVYDQFGQRIQHWNSQYEDEVLEKTAYDALGRVISQTDMEDHETITEYTWDGDLVTDGMESFGGWEQFTSYSGSSLNSTVRTDLYGRELYKSDLGDHVFTSIYDAAGRLFTRTTSSNFQTWFWYNTGLLRQSYGLVGVESYSYDIAGNRLTEKLEKGADVVKDAVATYDALGRLSTFHQEAASFWNGDDYTSPEVTNEYYYDAVGNIRQTISTYSTLDDQGGVVGPEVTDTYWFKYDAMNRLIVDRGVMDTGEGGPRIVRGTPTDDKPSVGRDIMYNAAGERVHVTRTEYTPGQYVDDGMGGMVFVDPSWQEVRENYEYYGNGTLGGIRISVGSAESGIFYGGEWYPPDSIPEASIGGGTLYSYFTYDRMGRQLSQTDRDTVSGPAIFSRTSEYNNIGQLTYETSSTAKSDGKTYTSTNNYTYAFGSEYLLGAVYQVSGTSHVSGSSTKGTLTTNSYDWFDGAVQSRIDSVADTSHPGKIGRSDFSYDGFGHLMTVGVDVDISAGANARDRTIYFIHDGAGQIIRRDEIDGSSTDGDPHEAWYRFNGRELGYTGNNGTSDLTADSAVQDRRQVETPAGAFRNGQATGSSHSDFSVSYDPLNSYNQGSTAGSYVVQQSGESLRSIAQTLWGDAALWYKLAEANGLQAEAALVEGQRLNVPASVTRSSHNAATLKPYDANEAVGNVSPTSPKPKKANKCGVFGQILLAAVAIAVTVVLKVPIAGALNGGTAAAGSAAAASSLGGAVAAASAATVSTAATIAGTALAATVGSAVSQGIGLAAGIQSSFSFKGVAMAALSGGVTAGLGGTFGAGWAGAAARGALSSAITQGVGVATGLQDKFSWTGVAVAGVGAGAGEFIGGKTLSLGKFGNRLAANTAGAMANAATRSVLTGTSFGDNVMRALPDAIGQTVGSLVAGKIAGDGRKIVGNETSVSLNARGLRFLVEPEDGDLIDGNRATSAYDNAEDGITVTVTDDSSSHGFGWKIADALGFHEGGFFYNLAHPGTWSMGTSFNFEWPYAGASLAAGGSTIVNNFRDDYMYRVDGGISSMGAGWATLNDGSRYSNGDGIAANLNTMKGLGSITGGAFQWLTSPISGPADTIFGRPISSLSNGAVSPRPAGDTVLAIGSMLIGPGTAFSSRTGSIVAAKSGPVIIEGFDASTLVRSHAIGGRSSTARVDDIAASMRLNGYVGDPLKVIQNDGRMIIVDGHHRTVAASRTGTPVTVQVVGPKSFPMGSGGWQSIDEVIQASQTAGPNRLNRPRR